MDSTKFVVVVVVDVDVDVVVIVDNDGGPAITLQWDLGAFKMWVHEGRTNESF